MQVVRQCHDEVLKDPERVVMTIKIDDYKGRGDRLGRKLESVKQKLRLKLNR